MGGSIKEELRKGLSSGVRGEPLIHAVPQLNEAETAHTRNMLVWLLREDPTVFSAMSPITFSITRAWEKIKFEPCTDGNPTYEGQACVIYHDQGQLQGGLSSNAVPVPRGLGSRPLQISWPRHKPATTIGALGVDRALENIMEQAWQHGKDAAETLELTSKADGPYEPTTEVHYILQIPDGSHFKKRYAPHIGMLADQGFPAETEKIHKTLEWILQGEPPDSSR